MPNSNTHQHLCAKRASTFAALCDTLKADTQAEITADKTAFTNDIQRKAELQKRLADHQSYIEAEAALEDAQATKARADIEAESLRRRFRLTLIDYDCEQGGVLADYELGRRKIAADYEAHMRRHSS